MNAMSDELRGVSCTAGAEVMTEEGALLLVVTELKGMAEDVTALAATEAEGEATAAWLEFKLMMGWEAELPTEGTEGGAATRTLAEAEILETPESDEA